MRLLHFGALGAADAASVRLNPEIETLPAAGLGLSVRIGDELYTCRQGAQCRLVESGRFLHRMDILGLNFASEAGKVLEAEGRLEIIAWPDSFTLLLEVKPGKALGPAVLGIALDGAAPRRREAPQAEWPAGEVRRVRLDLFPSDENPPGTGVSISAHAEGQPLKVVWDPDLQWHRVELRTRPEKDKGSQHLEASRVRFRNGGDSPRQVKVNFAKAGNIPGITGLVAMYRDVDRYPTGIPLQLSKNWHVDPKDRNCLYQGPWLHVLSVLTLPPHCDFELEFCLVHNFWGSLPLASHAQLCVIGCGLFQLWDQAAIGSWGESICYNPDQCSVRSVITDMRPLMVHSMKPEGDRRWNWTSNVGGGDFLVYHNKEGKRQKMTEVRARYFSQGPNLSDVCYSGLTADGAVASIVRVQTPRCQDMNRAYHHLRYEVLKPVEFSRLAFYQLGGDLYNDHLFRLLATGDSRILGEEWRPQLGGRIYHRRSLPMAGEMPWISLHQELGKPGQPGPWANRGMILRSWKARLGGHPAGPHYSSFGTVDQFPSANVELSPPPGLSRLQAGDFVEASIELLVLPQFARDYYGPDARMRRDLIANEDTWKLVFRQAALGMVKIDTVRGELLGNYPIRLKAEAGEFLEFRSRGGLTHTPVTISGLRSYRGHVLQERLGAEWREIDQSAAGKDFWQVQYDAASDSYSLTYNLELGGDRHFRLIRKDGP
jgi:hypothetical protein